MRAYSREVFKHKYSPNAAFGRPKFLAKMRVTEILCSATLIADMALVMLFFFLLSSSCWR